MSTKEKKTKKEVKMRPPIVVILGHVDHGKTTLLDYIRKTKVVESEAGGITQHIGAYQVSHQNKFITFIDTPGHEIFGKMRSRGVQVADIAVLVVAAEEGVKPQTLESLKYIQEAEIPFIVALNKIDKAEANPDKVKRELSQNNVLIEEWGGKSPLIPISAKTGQGVPDLLEMILLMAELEELKLEEGKPFDGVIIESFMDAERGPTATIIVKRGVIKTGVEIACGKIQGKVKILEDFRGQSIKEARPSMPARIIGFKGVPEVGEICAFAVGDELFNDNNILESVLIIGGQKGAKTLHLILKADTHGSLEAIITSLKGIRSETVTMEVLKSEIGDVNEDDIKMARSAGAIIASFNMTLPVFIRGLAQRNNVKIVSSDIIYEVIDQIKNEMSLIVEVETIRRNIGHLEVLAVFRTEKQRMIVGGKVTMGFIQNKAEGEVIRSGEIIAKGRIIQVQKNKQAVERVEKPDECGVLFEGQPVIKEGDILEAYIEERMKKSL